MSGQFVVQRTRVATRRPTRLCWYRRFLSVVMNHRSPSTQRPEGARRSRARTSRARTWSQPCGCRYGRLGAGGRPGLRLPARLCPERWVDAPYEKRDVVLFANNPVYRGTTVGSYFQGGNRPYHESSGDCAWDPLHRLPASVQEPNVLRMFVADNRSEPSICGVTAATRPRPLSNARTA